MSSITREDFENFLVSFADDPSSGVLRNGFALHLVNKHSHNLNLVSAELDMYFQSSDSNYISNQKAVSKNLKLLIKKVSIFKKRLSIYWHRIQHLLREPILVPQKRKKTSPAADVVPATPIQDKEPSPLLVTKLRSDCGKCAVWSSKYQNLERELKEVKVVLNTVSRKYRERISVNRCNKRLHERISKLKKENCDLKNQIIELQKSENKFNANNANEKN